MTVEAMEDVRVRYQQALDSLIEKVKRDPYIVAAILLGSLSHDVVWEKSDIDLMLVTEEGKKKSSAYCLVEDGINIHVNLGPRSDFKRLMEGAIQSSFTHSLLIHGTLLFTRDDSIEELFESRHHLGARDREIQLLRAGSWAIAPITKAEKWLYVKNDVAYSFFWIMKSIDSLATIEVLMAGEVTGREVVLQALKHNPEFFHAIYTDLIDQPKTQESVVAALDRINQYLLDRAPVLFRPILTYLAEQEGVRSATELNHYFSNQMGLSGADSACEWLADQEIIQKVSTPVRLTEKSRVDVEEAAYYYEGDDLR
jgi:hypothetical protein